MIATDRLSFAVRCLAGGVLTGLVLWVAAGRAQAPPASRSLQIADVIPQGLRHTAPERIMGLIRTRPGTEYNQDTVNDDVRRLYETRNFANVQVRLQDQPDGRVVVCFLMAELPSRVQQIIYHGNKHLKPDELETITGVRKGTPLNPVTNQMARQAILNKYHEKGRMFASVDLVEGGKEGDTRVVFNITEGPVVKVSAIDFTGVQFVTEARLRTQIHSSSTWFGLLGGDFRPEVADLDVAKLTEYYRSFGFEDVRVSRELQWADDHRTVKLVYHVQEGPRYRVGDVQLSDTRFFHRERVSSVTKLRPGEYYDENVVRADLNNIKDLYGYTGRDVVAAREVFHNPQRPGEVTVQYNVIEREPAVVGQIIVVGNEVTRQNVILRQIPLYPGQPLTYPDLRVAERNLARLNIFESNPEMGVRPTVDVLDRDSNNPVKDLLVTVQETHTGSLLFGVGVNSDAGLTGSIVLNERNFDILRPPTSLEDLLSGHAFRGAGQELRIEAVPGTQLQRYSVSFREPFLFDSPYSLGLSGYYFTRRFNEYDETRLGGRVNIGRKLNDYWTVTGGLRLEQIGVNNVIFFAPPQIADYRGQNTLVGVRAGVTRDTRDSFLRPTEGSLVEASFEQCFGDYTFPVASLEANKYFTLLQRADGSGRHVLAARSQVAWAGSNTPVFERFYAGGFRSMRGFEFRGVGPDVNGFKVGGDFMFLNSLEYQLPILANDHLYAVAFVDSGTVEAKPEINNYRVTAGAGLRIVVPMLGPVPIALDFGFPIVKAAADRDQIFSFWVGFFH